MRKFASYLVPALVLLAVLALQFKFPDEIESLRIKVFDVFQWLHPREYRDTPVRIIDIDDESLKKYGQWPWPRTLVAELVAKLDEGGAKVISFDAVFAEPDWTSPANVIPLWSKNPEASALLSQVTKIVDHDAIFAGVIARSPVVLAFGLTPEANDTRPAIKSGFVEHGASGDTALNYVGPVYRGAVTALPKLESAAKGSGCFNTGAEWDSTIRRAPTFFRLNDTLYPSLVLETLRVYQEESTYKIKLAGSTGETSLGANTGFVKVRDGLLDISTDSRGRIWLYDTGYRSERFIPAWKVLEGKLDPKALNGTVLFIGSSATGIKDTRATPLDPRAPGVEIHAQLAEQMFLNDFLERPDWAEGAEFIFLTLVGILLLLILPRVGAVFCAFLGVVVIGSAIGLSWYAFERWRFLIDPVFPSVAVLLIYLVSSFLNFLGTERERSQIRGAFGRYLSPVLVEKLAKSPKQLRLGGEMRVMSFLFTDIRNFTGIAEQMKPEALTQFMNRFLTPMTNIVLQYGGTIDKYIGDCIMAFWNAPLDDKDHARHACLATLDMENFIRQWNQESEEGAHAFPKLRIGIGINTGQACVGNMGSEQRFDYTVLGDHVNLASRLESLSKNYGVTALVGQNTADAVTGLAFLEVDLIRVKGKKEPVKISALLGGPELKDHELFREVREYFGKMMEAYRNRRWEEAEATLNRCRRITLEGIDLGVLYELYSSRIFSGKITPPPPAWDGVTTADSK